MRSAIDVGQLLQRVGDLHQVVEDLAAPVPRDRVGERLAVAGRAVRVRERRRRSPRRDRPASRRGRRRPTVLRPAVDVEDQRVAPSRVEAVRLDEKTWIRRPSRAVDPDRLGRPDVDLALEVGVVAGHPRRLARPAQVRASRSRAALPPSVARRRPAAVGGQHELVEIAVLGQPARRTAREPTRGTAACCPRRAREIRCPSPSGNQRWSSDPVVELRRAGSRTWPVSRSSSARRNRSASKPGALLAAVGDVAAVRRVARAPSQAALPRGQVARGARLARSRPARRERPTGRRWSTRPALRGSGLRV